MILKLLRLGESKMKIIKELLSAIMLKKESLRAINDYSIKKVFVFFIVTNLLFPFTYNVCYLFVKQIINMRSILTLSYFIMWNILINLSLFLSLWLIFFVTYRLKLRLFFNAVVFMNLLQPLEVFLSYTINNLFITVFFIIYDVFFVTEFIKVNIGNSELSKKQIILYVLIAFLFVYIFLSVTENTYMIYGEKLF